MNQREIQELIDGVKEAIEELLEEMSEILYPIEELTGFIEDIESFEEEHDMDFETDFKKLKFNAVCSLIENSNEYSQVNSRLRESIDKLERLRDNNEINEGLESEIDKKILNPLHEIKGAIDELVVCDTKKGIKDMLKKSIKQLESIEL